MTMLINKELPYFQGVECRAEAIRRLKVEMLWLEPPFDEEDYDVYESVRDRLLSECRGLITVVKALEKRVV